MSAIETHFDLQNIPKTVALDLEFMDVNALEDLMSSMEQQRINPDPEAQDSIHSVDGLERLDLGRLVCFVLRNYGPRLYLCRCPHL